MRTIIAKKLLLSMVLMMFGNSLLSQTTIATTTLEPEFYGTAEIIYLIIAALLLVLSIFCIIGMCDPDPAIDILWRGKREHNLYKMPFMTFAPYKTVLKIVTGIIVAMLGAFLVMFIVGAVGWLLFWIFKILVWTLIIVGWILFIGGIFCCFFGFEGIAIGIVIGTLGGFIVFKWKDDLKDWGNEVVELGERFFDNMNMFGLIKTLIVNYWYVALIIIATPVVLLLTFALFAFLVDGLLLLIENITMKKFNIVNPCPICQKPSEPAIYQYKNKNGVMIDLPVNLRPGRYGILHIKPTDMADDFKLPTMFFNGKDKLVRRCPHCGNCITALTGTEKHIGIVGVSNSGKTTLLYRMIGVLCKEYGESISFTDVKAHDSGLKEAIEKINSMSLLTELKTSDDYPLKTSKQRLRSIQLIANRQNSKMPYHLYFNDIAGESFSITGEGNVDFIKNVQSIIFVIDPDTTDFSDIEIGKDFAKWLKKQTKHNYGKVALREMFDILLRELISVRKEDVKNIILNVVLIKTDLGYYNFGNNTNEASIKSFIKNEMGQHDIIYGIDNNFDVNKIHYHAVSAASLDDYSNLTNFTNNIMKQLAVNIKYNE